MKNNQIEAIIYDNERDEFGVEINNLICHECGFPINEFGFCSNCAMDLK